jgi:HK97 family phage major capsid protein
MSWQVIKDLKEKQSRGAADMATMRDLANKENRDFTADENTRYVALETEVDGYIKRMDREGKAAILDKAINQNRSENIGRDSDGRNTVDMPDKDFKRYSVLRAMRRQWDGLAIDGVEGEVSAELQKRHGTAAKGFYMPSDFSGFNKRALNTTTGTGSVMTTTEATFIDVLRARCVTGKIGTTFLTNLQGKVAIPQKTASSSYYWVGDGGAATGSNPVLAQVLFQPKTIGGYIDITRQFLEQTSLDAEAFVVDDLTKSLAVGIDTAAFNGTGSSNQPVGICTNGSTGVTVNALGVNGSNPSFVTAIALETTVSAANADMGSMAYVTSPACRGYLKGLPKSANAVAAGFVWDDNEINGYPAYATNIIPSNLTKGSGSNLSQMIFGNFNDLVIAMWGGLDITFDPYTGSASGTKRFVALQDIDIELRHAASFAINVDAQTV